MRKVSAHLFSSLDGVVSNPGEFQFDHFGTQEAEAMDAATASATEAIMGRVIYEEWASWWPAHPDPDDFGAIINPMPKHVASTTLHEPLKWENSTLIDTELTEFVRDLKRGEGGDILVFGISVIRQLLQAKLLDELQLTIHPVLKGTGKRLYDGTDFDVLRLELVSGKTTSAGNAQLVYRAEPNSAAVVEP